ncbi:hypothetical protein PR048_010730 [Dryococelus australis]|uniref:Uncharacterized protein n=1 Tax=Dryococelus australis TaxID=614101 RepID=A0ABQ9I3J6_9NEOP|nr:hypothetical protein PR048_010730 [Dryococelus australis]
MCRKCSDDFGSSDVRHQVGCSGDFEKRKDFGTVVVMSKAGANGSFGTICVCDEGTGTAHKPWSGPVYILCCSCGIPLTRQQLGLMWRGVRQVQRHGVDPPRETSVASTGSWFKPRRGRGGVRLPEHGVGGQFLLDGGVWHAQDAVYDVHNTVGGGNIGLDHRGIDSTSFHSQRDVVVAMQHVEVEMLALGGCGHLKQLEAACRIPVNWQTPVTSEKRSKSTGGRSSEEKVVEATHLVDVLLDNAVDLEPVRHQMQVEDLAQLLAIAKQVGQLLVGPRLIGGRKQCHIAHCRDLVHEIAACIQDHLVELVQRSVFLFLQADMHVHNSRKVNVNERGLRPTLGGVATPAKGHTCWFRTARRMEEERMKRGWSSSRMNEGEGL